MIPHQVALVSETSRVSPSSLTRVAGALQKQAIRDFAPIWGIRSTVGAFASLDDVPVGYWPIVVMDDIQTPGAAGVHEDDQGQPFALVQYETQWSLTASHECLEMLADPFGRRLVAGNSVDPKRPGRGEYLVEVCDPCEAPRLAYTVNGVVMSDFYTPHFFDPVASGAVRYSFRGSLTRPREVVKGGYLSWHEPSSNHWYQERFFGAKPEIGDLGVMARSNASLRSQIDRLTPRPGSAGRPRTVQDRDHITTLVQHAKATRSTNAKARAWRKRFGMLKSAKE